ncbi:MAG: hypothetical protein MUF18_00865 [Fimbriiglobus sp.]|jgi:hypothetical protein|nr:hypothetical protein [Fimbriiglobus sp.]
MLSIPVPFSAASLTFALPFPGVPVWVRVTVVVLAMAAVAVLLFVLYRREVRLVPKRIARLLVALRVAAVLAVFLTTAADPTLVTVTSQEIPSRVLIAVDTSDSLRVADPQRPADELQRIAATLNVHRPGEVSRLKIAEHILTPDGADLLGELAKRHAVELVAFDQVVRPLPLNPVELKVKLDADRLLATDTASSQLVNTDLQGPVLKATESAADTATSKLVGVVLLTDGRHNWGDSPLPRVPEFAARGIPIHSVVLAPVGLPPADVAVVSAQPQVGTVFKGSVVPVEVSVRVSGWPAGPIEVSMTVPPDERGQFRPPVKEVIQHDGQDQTYQFALRAKLDAPGPQSLTVTVTSDTAADKFPSNNVRIARVNVVKDRARVLLVDGDARWEFHYLHTCLGRDENMDVRSVVFRQPRITTATDETLKKFGTPARALPLPDEIAGYDCVVLGDVEPQHVRDWAWLEKYVAEDGGTLVVVAGKRAMPAAYLDDANPLRKLLPVTALAEVQEKNGFRLGIAPDGRRSWFLQLGDTSAQSRAVWEGLPPHYWAVTGRLKDGAEVLAEANGAPLVARQNYGFGRVLYIGIDSTWRWRYKVGDKYHHKFWGQVAQWAASDRLLPTQNPAGTIRFGTREPAFRTGQEVEVLARGTEAVEKLTAKSLKGVRVIRLPAKEGDGEKLLGLTLLQQPDGRPRDVAGKLRDLTPGRYALELVIADWESQLLGSPGPDGRPTPLRSTFEVLPPDTEEVVELSADLPLIEEIAANSGGKVYQPEQVKELIEKLRAEVAKIDTRVEYPARKSFLMLMILLGLLTTEWGVRKWVGLP